MSASTEISVFRDPNAAVLARARNGEASALSELVAHCLPAVQRQVQRFPLGRADQHDLVQEALLQVIRKLDSFRGDARFSTWLYRITANAGLMKLRSIRRRRSSPLDAHEEEIETTLAATIARAGREWSDGADVRLDSAQRRARLDHALSQLPPGYREVITDHYIDGSPLQQIADRLGTTESAVRSRLHRARSFLRRDLADLANTTESGLVAQDRAA